MDSYYIAVSMMEKKNGCPLNGKERQCKPIRTRPKKEKKKKKKREDGGEKENFKTPISDRYKNPQRTKEECTKTVRPIPSSSKHYPISQDTSTPHT